VDTTANDAEWDVRMMGWIKFRFDDIDRIDSGYEFSVTIWLSTPQYQDENERVIRPPIALGVGHHTDDDQKRGRQRR